MTDLYRTGLYVPGDRPDRFRSAEESGADLVVFDLEDAVAPQHKATARDAVVDRLRDGRRGTAAVQVRVNAGDDADLRAVAGLAPDIGIRLPKVESVAELDRVAAIAPDRPVIALLESARGVVNAVTIAEHPAVVALALGESDLRSELGGGEPVITHARLSMLFAARAAGLPTPMASVYPGIRDLEGLADDTRRASELGLFGRMAAHPIQLPVIAGVFAFTGREVAWAREVVAVLGGGGVATLSSGEMVDQAMRGRAEWILRAAESGS
ncbi:(3S)-malyl-CoA thioesterase [Microbacterium oxydans]|uniref:HpcH/HpaI aldolase/citrate lyase family protein n=1 Tax=Microbacterium oxydans TaxID=82380 RepID=UPI001E07068F|nr:CoA ester lyase [Microbacterium oxydans]CAH0216361.1 (3S)-malyl-CoA thioesterase [Microbacterium oxydans]